MDMDHDMGMAAPPPSTMVMMKRRHFMHMTFFWGTKSEVLFDQWPGDSRGMYALALLFVFVMSFLVEWLSHTRFMKPGSNKLSAGLCQTVLHLLRVGLAYLVMLALMSFNAGVFLMAVLGHALGFFFFGSRAFAKPHSDKRYDDLPPMSC
ncbi:copper transporter 2-like [Arachis stenosperma]|uniref:copper transporter 2-like n=1 Tax=Arachis stenosperma TaxID=217475 RepID=UPI0025AD5774|nr:copper transporter 2-like [Arachis stenosperma]